MQDAETVLNRLHTTLVALLEELAEAHDPQAATPALLKQLIRRYHRELSAHGKKVQALEHDHDGFLAALQDAADGKRPSLDQAGSGWEIAQGVYQLVASRDLLEQDNARLRAELTKARSDADDAREALTRAEADPEGAEDERLKRYRAAFALLERGEDPQEELEAIREIERVFVATTEALEQARKRLDHCLDTLAKHLGDLHRVLPLDLDPRRYRPRLVRGAAYDLRRLSGVILGFRDAARHCGRYLDEAHASAGTEVMTRGLEKLRPAFLEMVRLVADCRLPAAGGIGRVTLSSQLNLQTTTGMASLPQALGADLQVLARSKKGKAAATEILPLLEEILTLYRRTLARAIEPLPEPLTARKNEKPGARLGRLTKDLLALAASQDQALHLAVERHWELHAEHKKLIDDPHLLLRALQDIEAGCEVLAVLPGAPATDYPPLPSARSFSYNDLLEPCRTRCAWLDEVARYRVNEAG